MEDDSSESPWPVFYECPACHGQVEAVAGETAQLVACPHCGQHFVVAATDGSIEIPEPVDEHNEKSREEELSALHIRSIAKEKRGLIRTQSYCLVGAGGCIVAAIQLAIDGIKRIHAHDDVLRGVSYLFFTVVLLGVGWHLARLSMTFYRKSREKLILEPELPPDFTPLSNENAAARKLEEMN